MASESLIRLAEKMYESGIDTTDYAKLLTQPAVDVMTKKLDDQKKITDELINKMPAGISIDKIPEELRPMVTDWLASNKTEYVKHAKVIASGIASDDPRYLEAIEGMNKIRSGFETLEGDLLNVGENIKSSLESRGKKSSYSELWQQTDHERFSNKSIYQSIRENGIGEGGKLSYTSADGNKKLTSDYGTFLTSGTGAAGVDALRKDVMNNAQKGMDFDELGNSNMVTVLVNELGAKGIGDLMYSNPMYIDEYIRLNHGGVTKETDKAAYDKIYKDLKKEDLTEEFTTHLLGTKENPGMLRTAHDAAFRPYTPGGGKGAGVGGRDTLPVNYGVGYITTVSANDFHKSIQNKDEVIQSPNGKYFKFVDGQYWSMNDKNEAGPKAEGSNLASNQFLLMDAGIWGQGYKLDNYTGTGAVTEGDDVPKFDPEFKGKKTKLTDFEKQQKELMDVANDPNLSKEEKEAKMKEIKKKYK